ncbi:MAG: hypothetical protein P8M14_06420 [Flavobacteriaceae bacterium]|nr:hypothetical protein [Flavobacteriaceae bacterium]MDG1980386.1 hypothetical protein [Flavobacteriaceae bacterium]MDG2445066.1 hypothetical protein [Flavobacteriaceae bacterium]
MENIFKYFDFSPFKKDDSNAFNGNQISYTELNAQHFLIFEKEQDIFNLYVSKYSKKADIGNKSPEILELLVTNYDKSNSEHRVALRRYLG